ncbi:hypothetical protein JCM3770_005717, partial [Rhodotorula araucariae]
MYKLNTADWASGQQAGLGLLFDPMFRNAVVAYLDERLKSLPLPLVDVLLHLALGVLPPRQSLLDSPVIVRKWASRPTLFGGYLHLGLLPAEDELVQSVSLYELPRADNKGAVDELRASTASEVPRSVFTAAPTSSSAATDSASTSPAPLSAPSYISAAPASSSAAAPSFSSAAPASSTAALAPSSSAAPAPSSSSSAPAPRAVADVMEAYVALRASARAAGGAIEEDLDEQIPARSSQFRAQTATDVLQIFQGWVYCGHSSAKEKSKRGGIGARVYGEFQPGTWRTTDTRPQWFALFGVSPLGNAWNKRSVVLPLYAHPASFPFSARLLNL